MLSCFMYYIGGYCIQFQFHTSIYGQLQLISHGIATSLSDIRYLGNSCYGCVSFMKTWNFLREVGTNYGAF